MNDNDICMNSCTIDAFHSCHPVAVAVVAMLLISLPSHMGAFLCSSAAVSCGRGYNRGGNIWVSLAQGSKRVRTAPEYSGISLYFLHSLNVLLFAMTGLVFQTENI